MFIVAV